MRLQNNITNQAVYVNKHPNHSENYSKQSGGVVTKKFLVLTHAMNLSNKEQIKA